MDIEAMRAQVRSLELRADALLRERDALLEKIHAACDHVAADGKPAFVSSRHTCVTTADVDECGTCTKCKVHFHRRKAESAAVQHAARTT